MKILLLLFFIVSTHNLNAQWESDSMSIYFDVNSSEPLNNEEVSIRLKSLGAIKGLKIIGYTDTAGTEQLNLILAGKRVKAVQFLLPDSIKTLEIIIEGETTRFGADKENRRVDILFQKLVEGTEIREYLILNIQFVTNKALIMSQSYPLVDQLVEKIKADKITRIELHGHVCCGPDMELSKNRALAARKKLVDKGIDAEIISCYGHSNFDPLYPEDPGAGNDKNKRVEVVLIRERVEY